MSSSILFIYVLAIGGSFVLSALFVPMIIKFAFKFNVIDNPTTAERKVHNKLTPLMGGTAIFMAVWVMVMAFDYLQLANFSKIPDSYLWGVFIGSALIMIGGFLDDKYNLKPWQQIIWPIVAAVCVLISGVRITYITNPIGDVSSAIIFFTPIIGIVISFIWLMGMMYTAKFLDGLDGLLAGVSAIASLSIFFVSMKWDVDMSATGMWALILFGALMGFLLFNWTPAKIFLGEGGSVFLGFMLGVLSIISGSKIITTLLVIGIPALDVLWVIIQRLIHKESPFSHADRKHLHYKLIDYGFSKRGAVLFLYLVSLAFALVALVGNGGFSKLVGLILLIAVMIILLAIIYFKKNKNAKQKFL